MQSLITTHFARPLFTAGFGTGPRLVGGRGAQNHRHAIAGSAASLIIPGERATRSRARARDPVIGDRRTVGRYIYDLFSENGFLKTVRLQSPADSVSSLGATMTGSNSAYSILAAAIGDGCRAQGNTRLSLFLFSSVRKGKRKRSTENFKFHDN